MISSSSTQDWTTLETRIASLPGCYRIPLIRFRNAAAGNYRRSYWWTDYQGCFCVGPKGSPSRAAFFKIAGMMRDIDSQARRLLRGCGGCEDAAFEYWEQNWYRVLFEIVGFIEKLPVKAS